MKATGVTRPIDNLGRIVIPKELRRSLNIVEDDTRLEIFVDGQDIVLRKYEPSCIFCGEASEITEYKGKRICRSCFKELRG